MPSNANIMNVIYSQQVLNIIKVGEKTKKEFIKKQALNNFVNSFKIEVRKICFDKECKELSPVISQWTSRFDNRTRPSELVLG